MINKPLIQKVMEKIEEMPSVHDFYAAHRETGYSGPPVDVWNQGEWLTKLFKVRGRTCGTAGCFAGWTAVLDGAVDDGDGRVYLNDRVISVGNYARKALGLSDTQAYDLFSGGNSKEDLRRIVNKLLESE